MRHLAALAVAGCLLTLAGCSSQNTTASEPASTDTTPASAPPTFSSSDAADDGLTGLGASRDYWNNHRNLDGNSPAADAAYGPDPALPPLNGRTGDRYTVVEGSDYIGSYQVNFHRGTSIDAALADVLHTEFPSDAVWEWKRTVPGGCYQAEVKSAALTKGLTSVKLGDGTGQAFVEFLSLPPGGQEGYDPHDITYAMVNLMSYANATGAPGC